MRWFFKDLLAIAGFSLILFGTFILVIIIACSIANA